MSIKLIAKLETYFAPDESVDSYKYYNATLEYFDEEANHNVICEKYRTKCEEYLFDYLYPDKQHICSKCGKSHKLRKLVKRIQCTHCGHKRNWLVGTAFHRSRIPLIKWFKFFAYSTDTHIDYRYISKILRLNRNTITHMSNVLCDVNTMYGLDKIFSQCCKRSVSTLTRFSYMSRDKVKQRLRIAASANNIASAPPNALAKKKRFPYGIFDFQHKEPQHTKETLIQMEIILTKKEYRNFTKTGTLPSRLLPPPKKDVTDVLFPELAGYLRRQTPMKMAQQDAFNKVAKKLDSIEKHYILAINSADTTDKQQWAIKMCLYKLRQWRQTHHSPYNIYLLEKREEEQKNQARKIHSKKTNIMREFIDSHHEHLNRYGAAFQSLLAIKDIHFWLKRENYAPLCILADYEMSMVEAA